MRAADVLRPAWETALKEGEQSWIAFLEEMEVFDGVAFAFSCQPAEYRQSTTLDSLLRIHLRLETRPSTIDDRNRTHALLVHTIERLADSIRDAMERALGEDDLRPIPLEGVLQYFGDDLAFCIYIDYRAPGGSAFHMRNVLPILEPRLFSDPIELVKQAKSNAELDVARRALYSRHKTVLLRNTLVHTDREVATFGPSIDTLLISDWLLTNRFAAQRQDPRNRQFFQYPVGPAATSTIKGTGARVLEVGTGSGLILATFAKNEALLHAYEAIDMSIDAINVTYRNTYRQRQLQGGWIGDRGIYTVGPFAPERITTPYDVVVCNPPYIPTMDPAMDRDRFSDATLGTDLLESLLDHCRQAFGDGCMYLVVSNTTRTILQARLPAGYDSREIASREVPFVVESAQLDEQPEYVAFLKRSGLRVRKVRGKTQYTHDVMVYSIRKAD
jgi:methylase of polypeptide subunit release factors